MENILIEPYKPERDKAAITWSWSGILFIVLSVIGGTFIQAGIMIIAASSAFWVVRSTAILDISIYSIRNYINYPITIYGRTIQILLTVLIPYAFVNFYSSAFLKKDTGFNASNLLSYQYISIIIGALLLLFSIWVFNRGIKRYESTGS